MRSGITRGSVSCESFSREKHGYQDRHLITTEHLPDGRFIIRKVREGRISVMILDDIHEARTLYRQLLDEIVKGPPPRNAVASTGLDALAGPSWPPAQCGSFRRPGAP